MPLPKSTGRRRVHSWRSILNGIFYVVKGGIPWRLGNGSSVTDTGEVVVSDEDFENNLVHFIRFRERQGFANETS
jgi:transposase